MFLTLGTRFGTVVPQREQFYVRGRGSWDQVVLSVGRVLMRVYIHTPTERTRATLSGHVLFLGDLRPPVAPVVFSLSRLSPARRQAGEGVVLGPSPCGCSLLGCPQPRSSRGRALLLGPGPRAVLTQDCLPIE